MSNIKEGKVKENIYADSYYGFVYALAKNENEIIYVELIFCNGFYDLKYENYINTDYLPDGFNAKMEMI